MQRGVEFISAANTQLDLDLMELHPYLRAVFTDRSSVVGRITGYPEPPTPAVERFRREMEDFVDKYLRTCKPGDKLILYLYTGGLAHVEVLYDIVTARPQVSAHINLFWCSWTRICNEAFSERWAETLRKVLLEDRLVLTVPTDEMQKEIQEAARVVLPVAPMPSTTFDDTEAKNALEQSELRLSDNTERANFNVLFPSLMRKPKGYDLSISVIRMLSKKQTDTCYQCTLRYIPLEGTPLKLIKLAQKARVFANIAEGVLRPDEFKRMLAGADIIVLPYQPSEFSNRTSGLLIDALLCGVPVVVQKGTWLGNLVARYDCGALAETASPEAYIKAIELVAANHHQYRKNAIKAGKKWLDTNSWATLLNFILESPPPLDVSHLVVPQETRRNVLGKVAWRAAARMRSLRRRSPYRRLVDYLMINYPTIITIGRFGKWSLTTLKKTFFGIGGIAVLVIVGLYVAGALIEPARWYLVGIATALLLLGGGLLTLSYARLWLNRFVSSQRRAMESTPGGINRDFSVLTNKQLDEREKQARWRTIKNLYRGQRAFIIGNGPSLNRTPLHLLKNEFTLCFNRFDLMFERLGWRPTMYMCVDDRVAENTASQINEIIPLAKFAFFPDIHPCGLDFRDFIEDAHNVFWLSLKSVHDPTGSYETLPTCSTRGTVAHLGLQVLAFLGFSPIYLVGVDMDYKEHKTVENPHQQKWTATRDDDPNHFDPRYFGARAKYYRPSTYKVLISGFEHAKELLDRKGIGVLNAGVGGSLEVFPRVDFRSLFNFEEDIELEMLLSAVDPELQQDALQALRGDKVIKVRDDWDEKSPFQVTTLRLAEQLIPKVIFTHIPYGPFGNRYLFIRREKGL
jgi:glycosyltransferase involved in cell wall biosynthesis